MKRREEGLIPSTSLTAKPLGDETFKKNRQREGSIEKQYPKTEYRPSIKGDVTVQRAINSLRDDVYKLRRAINVEKDEVEQRFIEQEDSPTDVSTVTEIVNTFPPEEGSSTGCSPFKFGRGKFIDSGMSKTYTNCTFYEFTYTTGLLSSTPTLRTFRIEYDLSYTLVNSFTLSQEMRVLFRQGHYLYGCKDGAGSSILSMIDIIKPDAPEVSDTIDVTDEINNLHVQGRYIYLATVGGLYIIDASDPTNLVQVFP